ncbi:beta-galactosidase [Gorillibacterium massiliense]|uniref:beta-galactosidase n=1 Tax=Gorillibacterium massiliense TaxID=1280390 RepID=UPI0004B71238|nr:beta-galactosidase [Gorillibacterium massiliense]
MEYAIDARISPKAIYPSTLKLGGQNPQGLDIRFTNYYMELGGAPFIAICGEFHYSRYPETDWEPELLKMKMSGINVIAMYIFWNHHEEMEGVFDWEGSRNLRKFTELCGRHGLYAILRIGPFCHGEVRNGGLPDWLFGRDFDVRSNDEGYLNYVRRLYTEIGRQAVGLMFQDGGPVIGIQLENEFNAAAALWELTAKQGDEYLSGGTGGAEHMRNLKQLAAAAGLIAPIYTSTGWGDAPVLEDEVLPLYGGYAYTPWSISPDNPKQKPTGEYVFTSYHDEKIVSSEFQPKYPKTKYPFACCEMGGGMQTWYLSRFIVEPESVLAMSMVKMAGGCNFLGYYMFHGGTNPVGLTGYLNESTTPRITYDFQAPIGEFGQIRESNHLLRPLHYFLQRFGGRLSPMATVLPEGAEAIQPEDTEPLRYALRTDGRSGFLFINNYQDHIEMKTHEHVRFSLNMNGGNLTFPHKTVLTIKSKSSMMLPFHFDLDGLNLRYATAQPVTSVEAAEAMTFFFAMPEGVDGEFAFDMEDLEHVAAEGGAVQRGEGGTAIVTVPHSGSAWIRVTREGKREIRLYVMSAKEAATLWVSEAAGKSHVLFSETPLTVSEKGLEFFANGASEFTFREYVFAEPKSQWASEEELYKVHLEEEGAFCKYRVKLPLLQIPFRMTKLHPHKVLLHINTAVLQDADDVIFSIDYTGNVGYAFSGGKLIHDHFHNGAPWELGLKRFGRQLRQGDIILETTPLRKGIMTVDADAAMAVERHFSGEQCAQFHQITAEPVRRILLTAESPEA